MKKTPCICGTQMKGDEIKEGDILEDFRYSRERLFHLGHDYKSPRVRSKFIKQHKAILWVARFYMIRMAHDGTTIHFFRFPGSPEFSTLAADSWKLVFKV